MHRIRQFVRFVNAARSLQEDLSEASVGQWENTFMAPETDDQSDAAEPALHARYERTELLMRAVTHILEEGFDGRMAGPEYVAAKVARAIAPYGLSVVRRPIER